MEPRQSQDLCIYCFLCVEFSTPLSPDCARMSPDRRGLPWPSAFKISSPRPPCLPFLYLFLLASFPMYQPPRDRSYCHVSLMKRTTVQRSLVYSVPCISNPRTGPGAHTKHSINIHWMKKCKRRFVFLSLIHFFPYLTFKAFTSLTNWFANLTKSLSLFLRCKKLGN